MSGRVVTSWASPQQLVAGWLASAAAERALLVSYRAGGPASVGMGEPARLAVVAHRHAVRAARAYRRLAPRLPG